MVVSTEASPAYSASQQHAVAVQLAPVTMKPPSHSSNRKGMPWTGIVQVVLGSLTVILGIVTATVFNRLYPNDISDKGSPIWCGIIFYVVAGVLGIVSGCKKNSGVAIGYMVISILSCVSALVVIGFAAAPVAYNSRRHCGYSYSRRCDWQVAAIGVHATLIILAIAEFVVAIVGASMTCGPLCNVGRTPQTVIHYQALPHVVVATQPQSPAFYNVPAGQPQVAYPAQQNLFPQEQAPPTGGQQYKEFTK